MTRRCITSWVPKAPAKTSMERKTTRIALGRDAVIDGAAPARTGFAWVFADGVGAAIVLSTSNGYRTSGLGAQGPSAQGGRKNRAMGRPLRRPALALRHATGRWEPAQHSPGPLERRSHRSHEWGPRWA